MTLCPLCQSPMLNYRCLTTIIYHWGIKNNHFVIDSNAELIFTNSHLIEWKISTIFIYEAKAKNPGYFKPSFQINNSTYQDFLNMPNKLSNLKAFL